MRKHNKTDSFIQTIESNEKYLLIGFLALIILHVIGGFWHSYYSWGFSYWSLYQPNIIIILGLSSSLAVMIVYYYRKKIKFDFIDLPQFFNKSKLFSVIQYTLILTILFFILYQFRSQAHFYGDGYSILDFCSTKSSLELSDQLYLQILSVYWHQLMFKLLSIFPFLNHENIFALTNVLGGIIGLWALWSVSNILHSQHCKRNFIFIIALSSASLILFFGYIESYTWVFAAGLWSLRFMIGYVKKKNGILPLLLLTVISLALHLISFPLFLTAIYAVLLRSDKFKSKMNTYFISILILVGSVGIVLLAQIKGSTIFVPLWEIPKNPYTLLSLEHLSDVLNQLIHVAPLSLVFLIAVFLQRGKCNYFSDDSMKILYLLSFLNFLSAIFIDPLLGAVRDWDLLSLYGMPLTIYVGYSFSKLYEDRKFPNWIIIASCIIVIIHIVPNLYEKNHPKLAVEKLDKILWDDPHYQSDYQSAERGNSWGYILQKNLKRYDLSEKYFVKRRKTLADDPTACYNLGSLYCEQGKYEEARHYLLKGIELYSHEPKLFSKLSEVEYSSQNMQLAETYARESLKIDSNFVQGLTALALTLFQLNQVEEALFYFRKAYNLEPNEYKVIVNLGSYFTKGNNTDSAYYYLKKAIPLAPEEHKVNILKSLTLIALNLNRRAEAIEYFNQLKIVAPNSVVVRELEKEIYKR